MRWKIGDIEIKNQVVLAPMAGISDPAYIKICEDMGVGLAFTELISAEAIVRNNQKTFDMLKGINELSVPTGIQLFGSSASTMAKAAKVLTDLYEVKLIDINMGCPVPKVALRSGAGSALLKDPDKVYDIVKKVVDSVDVPVTVKIRSGWDEQTINAIQIAKKIELAGASAITVHARTRSQGYSGLANWDIIRAVKDVVSIPVIGNGDIRSCYDAKRMIDETGCDAIMIGRGLLGNPWLIKECVDYLENAILPKKIDVLTRIDMIKKHLINLLETKPYKVAMLQIRTHASYYVKGIPKGRELKLAIFNTKTKEELVDVLNRYLEEYNAY